MDTNSLINRVMRVLRFDASVYREVAADANALPQALTLVVAAAVLSGLGNFGQLGTQTIVGVLVLVVLGTLGSLIGYALYAGVAALVAQNVFQGKTNFQEMARTLGFAYVWNGLGILSIIPCVGPFMALLGNLVAIVAGVIALRESAEFDTTKAVITAVVAGVVAGFAAFCATGIIGLPIIAMLGAASGAGQ
jgi:hypothetical protein